MAAKSAKGPGVSLSTVAGVLFTLAAVAGFMAWRVQLQVIDRQTSQHRSAFKKLHVAGKVPPNREVKEYLEQRGQRLAQAYAMALSRLAPMVDTLEGSADPQLYFQQRVHEVQRTLERLASARKMKIPDQLGFPKELPPADAAPRLLLQLKLIEDAAEIIMEQGISQLVSVRVEDPQPLPAAGEEETPFLMSLPVRLRFAGSLSALTKVLGALDGAVPLMDIQNMKVVKPPATQELEAELVVARYLVINPELPKPAEEPPPKKGTKKSS